MAGYDLDSRPLYSNANTGVSICRGKTKTPSNSPRIIKRHEFLRNQPRVDSDVISAIEAGLAQARVKNRHSCHIHKICVDFESSPDKIIVDHVMEALDTDLWADMKARKESQKLYLEKELWELLVQMSEALNFAHKKVTHKQHIAHLDIKPANILIDSERKYKICDFGCFFEQKNSKFATSNKGNNANLTPEQCQVANNELDKYDVYKADVYQLGKTLYSMANLELNTDNWPLDTLDTLTREKVENLPYSRTFKDQLISMLLSKEEQRPDMRKVSEDSKLKLGPYNSPDASSFWTNRLKQEGKHSNSSIRKFVCVHPALRSIVGIKQISCESVKEARKFETEAEILKLNPHQNVLGCLEWKREPNPDDGVYIYTITPGMRTNLLTDVNMHATNDQHYPEDELWNIYHQLVEGCCHLQNCKIPHGGIKPEKIYIDSEGQIKIGDWEDDRCVRNASRTVGPDMSYEAPERNFYQSELVPSIKSDVFSVGVLLTHLSFLYLPDNFRHSSIDSILSKLTTMYSSSWVNLLSTLLYLDKDKRPDFLMLKSKPVFADDEPLPDIVREEVLSLAVCCGLNKVRVSAKKVDEVPCMISITAKTQNPNIRNEYMDLVCVLDQSASMTSPLIRLMKTTLAGIIEKMGEKDRVSLIGYSEQADRKCPLIKCTEAGKERLVQVIGALGCKGEARIFKGIGTGIDVLKQRIVKNQTAKLLIFSGTRSRIFESDNEQCISSLQQQELTDVAVYTFGYGEETDGNLLGALAKQGKGLFCHITEQKMIAPAISNILCNSNTAVAQKISVTLKPAESNVPCKIKGLFPKGSFNPVQLSDFHAGDKKDILCVLEPRLLTLMTEAVLPTLQVTLKYEESNGSPKLQTTIQEIKFVPWRDVDPGINKVKEVYLCWYCYQGEVFLSEAVAMCEQGKYRSASNIISKGIKTLQSVDYNMREEIIKLKQLGDSINSKLEAVERAGPRFGHLHGEGRMADRDLRTAGSQFRPKINYTLSSPYNQQMQDPKSAQRLTITLSHKQLPLCSSQPSRTASHTNLPGLPEFSPAAQTASHAQLPLLLSYAQLPSTPSNRYYPPHISARCDESATAFKKEIPK